MSPFLGRSCMVIMVVELVRGCLVWGESGRGTVGISMVAVVMATVVMATVVTVMMAVVFRGR